MPKLNLLQKIILYLALSFTLPSLVFLIGLIIIMKASFEGAFLLTISFTAINLIAFSSVYYIFRKKVYLPLSGLFKNLKNLSNAQTEFEQKDEIREASEWINHLRNNLKSYSEKFQAYNQMIDAQTKELSLSLSTIADPVIAIDLSYKVILFNKAASDFSGIPSYNALGQPIYQIFKIYDKNKEVPLTQYAPLHPGGYNGEIFNLPEGKIVTYNNKETFADITVTQIKEGPVINLGAIITFHDKTKEKQLEAMKLDFVSMAAHELRTPLTTIKGYISVFIQENEKKLTQDQMMFVRRINTASQQLSSLVENLLSVSRVERGALSLNLQVLDWTNNVSQTVLLFDQRAREKRIELTFEEPEQKIPQVKADLVRINEVLSNIISNAINYTEPGGKINVSMEVIGDQVITHIRDTGRGISKETLPHLFTKFFRVGDGTAEQASKGNGLGLYISKAIVELHKGKIWAQSQGIGRGSTFSFSLPVYVQEQIDINILTKAV